MDRTDNIVLLKKALDRQKEARKAAERILECKSRDLYQANQKLTEAKRQLEGLLKEKSSKLEGVFTNIIDPYLVFDLNWNILDMNAAAKEFFGTDHNKQPLNFMDLLHTDYVDYTEKSFKIMREVGLLKNYRAKFKTKGNKSKFFHMNSSLIFGSEDSPIAAQGILRDTTSETEIKQLLEKQKKRLDIMLENSPLGIVLTNQTEIIKVNSTFAKILGYSPNEIKKLGVDQITVPKYLNRMQAYFKKMVHGGLDNFTVEQEYIKKNGDTFLAKTSVNASRDNKGQLEYQVAMIEDITEQRQLEIQKEQLLADLEESNGNLEEYAHIVSHDLKSPLRSINALTSWIKEDFKNVIDERAQGNLTLLQEKVELMDKLIDGILTYSTANKKALESKEVDLNKVIKEIMDSIFIPDHVQIMVPEILPKIWADQTKMRQLFQNFLSNAVMHIDNPQGFVKVMAKELPEHWQFEIEDNGVGIPEAYHDKIFKIFHSASDKENSTGIGLSIVKKIVELYEGEVWLQSQVNQGTTFYFTLKKKS